VLCRRWNWRECEKSKLTEATKNALLVVEGIPPVTRTDIEVITSELATLVRQCCGVTTQVEVLSSDKPNITF
jgi:lysyl-tRNA synthetase class 2